MEALVGCYANHPETRTGARRAGGKREARSSSRDAVSSQSLHAASETAPLPSDAGARVGSRQCARPGIGGDGRHLSLSARVRRRARAEGSRDEACCGAARRRACEQARGGPGDRLRPPAVRRQERTLSLGHDHARARRSRDAVDLSPLVPPRLAGPDPLPRSYAVYGPDQRRLREVWPAGLAADGQGSDGARHQLPDHGQLPRLRPARGQAGRSLDGRRPSLLQRERRLLQLLLREDRPPARIPEARRKGRARLRTLPAHGLRSLSGRETAAVREGVQEPDSRQLQHRLAAQGAAHDHRQRRRGAGRRQQRVLRDRQVLRRVRLRPAQGSRLPDEDPGARGICRAVDGVLERLARGRRVHAP